LFCCGGVFCCGGAAAGAVCAADDRAMDGSSTKVRIAIKTAVRADGSCRFIELRFPLGAIFGGYRATHKELIKVPIIFAD
jgi:hypothetical protein